MELPSHEALRCFLAAARRLNFRAAAAEVHMTPAALGKRIQQLERLLDRPLFVRTTRSVALTESGLRLIPEAERALADLEACVRATRGETDPPPQELTLGTRHELGLSWVLPQLDALEQALPNVTLQLYFGSGPDLELRVRTGEVDCAISSRRLEDPRLDVLPLHTERYVLVAKPKLLERAPLETAGDAAAHELVDVSPSLPLLRYWRDAAPSDLQLEFGRVRVLGTIAAARWWVLKGRAVGVLPRYLVEADLDRGRLAVCFPRIEPLDDQFRLLFRRADPRRSLFVQLASELVRAPLQ